MSKQTKVLLCVVGILFLQFFLRAHNPTELAFFWDENRHIERAAAVVDGGHPAINSHGKFLLYAWLAPFNPDRSVALHVSRSVVALFSLLGTAALFALTKRLFNQPAAFGAILFYAVVPMALFFERMVLADGLAAALGMLTAWQSVRFASYPTYKRASWVGILAGLAVMAKLTMTFSVVLMPVLAVLLLGNYSPEIQSLPLSKRLYQQFKIHWWYFFTAGLAFVVVWLPTLIPAAISGLNGNYYVLVDQSLIDESVLSSNDTQRWSEIFNQLVTMLSIPMLVLLVSIVILGLWKSQQKIGYILFWLSLIWIPSLLLVWRTQTRYLMPATYPIAILFGSGIYLIANHSQKRFGYALIGTFLIGWLVLFALPFDAKASQEAESLKIPRWDDRDYFQAPWNGYGLIESLSYLEANGQVGADGQIHILGIAWMCENMDLYRFSQINLKCIGKDFDEKSIAALESNIYQQPPISYLILEQHRKTLFIPENPLPNAGDLSWERIASFQRPHNGLWVTVWEVQQITN